jgi:hypothetical protein
MWNKAPPALASTTPTPIPQVKYMDLSIVSEKKKIGFCACAIMKKLHLAAFTV